MLPPMFLELPLDSAHILQIAPLNQLIKQHHSVLQTLAISHLSKKLVAIQLLADEIIGRPVFPRY